MHEMPNKFRICGNIYHKRKDISWLCSLTWSTFLPDDSLPHILTMPVPCPTLHGYSLVCLTSVTKTQGGQGYVSEWLQ